MIGSSTPTSACRVMLRSPLRFALSGDLSDLRPKLRPTEPVHRPGRRARPTARSASIPALVARSALRLEVRLDEPQPLVDAARHLGEQVGGVQVAQLVGLVDAL